MDEDGPGRDWNPPGDLSFLACGKAALNPLYPAPSLEVKSKIFGLSGNAGLYC